MWFRNKRPAKSAATVAHDLRAQALSVESAALGLTSSPGFPHVWGIIMETGYPSAVASLVAFADGTVSLYFSTGGGVIGAGEQTSVRATMEPFFALAEARWKGLAGGASTPLPGIGRVQFILRTFEGTRSAEAAEHALVEGHHELSPLFHAGHAMIAAIRELPNT